MSIKTRIIITFTLLTTILVIISTRVGYVSMREIYLNQLSDQTNLLTRLTAKSLSTKYLSFLDSRSPGNLAFSYYAGNMKAQSEVMKLTNIFIFDDNFRVLLNTSQDRLTGKSNPRLLLNRTEIKALKIGQSTTSLPFKGEDGKWYMWGFYRMNRYHWLGIQENADRLAKVESLSLIFWGIGITGLLLTVFSGWLLAVNIAKPIDRLVNFSHLLGKGYFDTPPPKGISGELAILANALDKMRGDLDKHHKEKETILAQIAHEIRNPLGGIELLAGLVKEDLDKLQSGTEYIEKILTEIAGLKSLITAYLNYSRPRQPKPEWVGLDELIDEVKIVCKNRIKEKTATVSTNTGDWPKVWFDRHHLRQILINLLGNSLEVLDKGGRILIDAQKNGAKTAILISDNGPGISQDNLSNIFEPFFTTRTNGTGLGLSICQKLCQVNQAEIMVENNPVKGCTFRVFIWSQA